MRVDSFVRFIFALLTFLFSALIVVLMGFLVIRGIGKITWQFLSSFPSNSMEAGGILPAVVGSAYFMGIALAFAVPVGVLGAVYLSEYSRESTLKTIVLSATNILSGIPSIVFGLFGLALFCIAFGFGTSVLAGGLTLGIMALPYVISNTYESIRAVPPSYREASIALGASKAQTTFRTILPAAFSRIITGVVIATGRIVGETAPLLFTGAAFYITRNPSTVFQPAMSLPTHIFVLSAVYPETVVSNLEGTISVLMIIVLVLFSLAGIIRSRTRRKLEG